MKPLISIIIPVYNAEKSIRRCVDSVLSQTYKEIEVILLDDGSSDNSGKICDEYAIRDKRVRVIHKANTGVSDTRNRGILIAKGEYLQFLDSDDWITADATSCLVRMALEHGCDMVIADFYRVINERVSQKGAIEEEGLMDRRTFATNMMRAPADFYYGVLWNKLYRRSVIEEHQIQMDSSISWCEDFMFNLEYVRHTEYIYVLKVPIYYYVKTKGSLVSQGTSIKKTVQMKRTVFRYYNNFYKDVFDEEDYEKRRLQVYRFLLDAAGDGSVFFPLLPGNYKLGAERTTVSENVQEGTGFFYDMYKEQKLQEMLFDSIAIRNDLSVSDIKILYYFSSPHVKCTTKEMASILNIRISTLTKEIKKLLSKGMIAEIKEDEKETDYQEYMVTEQADSIMAEIMFSLDDFEQIEFEGFTQEEIEIYEKLQLKRKQNIQKALR